MNPYQPPLAKDEPPVTESFVMRVGYGRFYRICLLLISILILAPQVFFFTKLHFWPPLLMSGFGSIMMVWVAFVCRRAAYFEVYDSHLLLLSPLSRRIRWKRPIDFRKVYRWVANGEEFAKFDEWRKAREVM